MSVISDQSDAASVKSGPEEIPEKPAKLPKGSKRCGFILATNPRILCENTFLTGAKARACKRRHCKKCGHLYNSRELAKDCTRGTTCQQHKAKSVNGTLTERRRMAPVGTIDTLGLDSPHSSSTRAHDACVAFVLILGLLLSVFLCLRCFRKKPKRDSFGFLPNSRRPSLTQAELMV